jgi:phosphopantothenoylcysteine decarboxylase/phosphopantothenate--cysteine ligase
MLEPTDIVTSLAQIAEQTNRLHNLKLIITAGPTQEAIDPVRYITNHSSGKVGYALARAAAQAGAQVTLISGPVKQLPPHNVRLVSVTTAEEMLAAVIQELPHCDIFIAAAAVVDYRVEQPATQKLKKSSDTLSLNLTKTPDILVTVSALPNKPFCVGFAAETEDLRKHALIKLRNKKLDMIAANLVGGPGQGFHADKNALTVLWNGGEHEIPLADKNSVAQELLEIILQRFEK